VWEAALAQQNRSALEEGRLLAVRDGVEFLPIDPEEQRTFDALYLRDAERNAAELAHYGIDGRGVFAVARASVGADGSVNCKGGPG